MSGKEAYEQRINLTGSGALSHVYIQHPPLQCNIPQTQGLYYDDANKLILSPTSDQVLSWKVGSIAQYDPPDSDSIDEGPILFIRYSLDRKIIAIQRSNHEIQFKNRKTGATFTQKYRVEFETIHGFFWTDCPTCDIVLIKNSGLDLFSFENESNRLRLVETKRLNVSWYIYTHESRLVLLASGMQCNIFSGFQFSSIGIVRLPKFEMKMTKTETNQKPVISAEDVNIVTIYGRIYCLHFDRVAMQLHTYRFYRDAVVQQGSLPVYSTRISVSVVDNVLLVHQVDAKVIILYDLFLDSLSPISAPLPLLVRGTSRGIYSSSSQSNTRQVMDVEPNALSAYEGIIFGDSWSFLVPDLVCDVDHGLLWKIHLDLEAITASSSEVPSVLEFLQRRRAEPMKAKQLSLALMRTMILERRPISVVSRAINILVVSYSQDIKMHKTSQRVDPRISSDNPISGRGENASGSRVGKCDTFITGSVTEVQNEVEHSIPKGPKNGHSAQHELSLASTINKQSACSDSDSEGIMNLEQMKTTAESSHAKHVSFDIHASGVENEIVNDTCDRSLDADIKQGFPHSGAVQHSDGALISNLPDHNSPVTSVVVSPDEMYHLVFSLVEEAMIGDPTYLVAVIVEFFRSAALEKLKVDKNLSMMIIKLLVCSDRHAELGMLILNKILEPSKEAALQLIQTGHKQTRKLGMDMLRQLLLHHEYVRSLSQHGYYLEALRYARKNKVIIAQPSVYLEAALSNDNLEHLAAVLRFFSEYIPGFENTSDHNKYYHIVKGMS